jgi:hypothetical protein
MDHWKKFKSLKQRGEWVELRFMACAAERGFYVLKPWGETRPYDVGIEYDQNFLRVQVKSTTFRAGTGYLLHFKPNDRIRTYAVDDFDLFAAYVVPADAWYIIPSALVLGDAHTTAFMLHPVVPRKRDRYCYEAYKEAWPLLYKSRRALAERARQPRRGGIR